MFFLTEMSDIACRNSTRQQQHNIYNNEKKQIITCTSGVYQVHGNT